MDQQAIVDILNELVALEHRNLARRLVESTLFVSRPSVEVSRVVEHMAKSSEEHDRWLSEVILELDGVPGIPLGAVDTADLHYLDLRRVLPRLAADVESLIHKYTLAANYVAEEPKAAEVVARILERHRQELASVRKIPVL